MPRKTQTYCKQAKEFYSHWHHLKKGSENKGREKNEITTYIGDSNIVTQPCRNPAEQGLTLLSRSEALLITQSTLFNDFPNEYKKVKRSSLRVEKTLDILPSKKPKKR